MATVTPLAPVWEGVRAWMWQCDERRMSNLTEIVWRVEKMGQPRPRCLEWADKEGELAAQCHIYNWQPMLPLQRRWHFLSIIYFSWPVQKMQRGGCAVSWGLDLNGRAEHKLGKESVKGRKYQGSLHTFLKKISGVRSVADKSSEDGRRSLFWMGCKWLMMRMRKWIMEGEVLKVKCCWFTAEFIFSHGRM